MQKELNKIDKEWVRNWKRKLQCVLIFNKKFRNYKYKQNKNKNGRKTERQKKYRVIERSTRKYIFNYQLSFEYF